jgi:putative molybdopterin biosynthesis protein
MASPSRDLPNRVKAQRLARGWSQAELAVRAGISRTAVSSIEGHRLSPSVTAALRLAQVFDCSVETLFGSPGRTEQQCGWAWPPPGSPWRYWHAEVGGRTLLYPVELAGGTGSLPHDGTCQEHEVPIGETALARQTLVLACCDPAVGLLATLYGRLTGFRLIAIPRSSQQAMSLLAQGTVHVAGLHLSSRDDDRNAAAVQRTLGTGYRLLRVASWQEGVAIARGHKVRSVRAAAAGRFRWVGREAGSGARQCIEELLPGRIRFRHTAADHRGVAAAIRSGWADAGVCLKLASDEAGLQFLSLREEFFELCFAADQESDPRIQSLVRVIRSEEYRRLLADLPGYSPSHSGEVRSVP